MFIVLCTSLRQGCRGSLSMRCIFILLMVNDYEMAVGSELQLLNKSCATSAHISDAHVLCDLYRVVFRQVVY